MRRQLPILALIACLQCLASSSTFAQSELMACGRARVDGVLEEREWQDAATVDFHVLDASGARHPATLYVMNDDQNLFLAVRVTKFDVGKWRLAIDFDNDGDGKLETGDDRLVVAPAFEGFADETWRIGTPLCAPGPVPSPCAIDDRELGGTRDGEARTGADRGDAIYEIRRPLASGDERNDGSLLPNSIAGVSVTFSGCAGCAVQRFPGSTYYRVRICDAGVAPKLPLSGCGSALIDGVLDPVEWSGAATKDFEVTDSDATVRPARLYVMNDTHRLYLAVRIERPTLSGSVGFEFDNDNDGVAEDGDDGLVLNAKMPNVLIDVVRSSLPPCSIPSPPAMCSFSDDTYGGTQDGEGRAASDGVYSVYEISHPLDSGDAQDFSLAPGDIVGYFLSVRFCSPCVDTHVPGFREYANIKICDAAPETPELSACGSATVDGTLSPGEWSGADELVFQAIDADGTPRNARLLIMNDRFNLYAALEVERPSIDGMNITLELDEDGDGLPASGDDRVVADSSAPNALEDSVRCDVPCTPGVPGIYPVVADEDLPGGSNVGESVMASDGVFAVWELSRPIARDDADHDVAVLQNDLIGFYLRLRFCSPELGCSDTNVPGPSPFFYGKIRVCPFGPIDIPPLGGMGSAAIDGVLSPGEWDDAGAFEFHARSAGGLGRPIVFYAMNDATNLYLAFEIEEPQPGIMNLSVEFDNDADGTRENGDDVLLVTTDEHGAFGAFYDEVRTNAPPCPGGGPVGQCALFDTSAGGAMNGDGMLVHTGERVIVEMSHPLDSTDDANDFSLSSSGDMVGYFLGVSLHGHENYVADFLEFSPLFITPAAPLSPSFRRGDANSDGLVDLSDAIRVLLVLYAARSERFGCESAADANASGKLDLSDAVYLLEHIFLDGAPPPPPYATCGSDRESRLSCETGAATCR